MADREFWKLQGTLEPDLVVLRGVIVVSDGSGTIDTTKTKTPGFTVALGTTGKYTLTASTVGANTYPATTPTVLTSVQAATASAAIAQVVSVDANLATVVMQVTSGGSAANLAASGDAVHYSILVSNSSVGL